MTALAAYLLLAISTATEQPPAPKLEIVQPRAGQELSGTIEVKAKITAPEGIPQPSIVYVGFNGGPYAAATQTGDSGEWTGNLDTTLAPNGEQTLTVLTDNKQVNLSVTVKLENQLRVFFADLHSHTSYSDGTLLPVVAHDYARNVAKLDVLFCLTDHLEGVDDEEWLDAREAAWDANEDGKFVVIPGLEWTTQWGHLNIYEPKTRVWPADPAEFYKAAADAGVVLKFNHPGDGTISHSGLEYSENADKTVQLMEVRGEKEEQAFIRALNNGWHIAPDGSHNSHGTNWGNGISWTGILAPGLSKRNVLDALKNRRSYSTLDRNCELTFLVNDAPMGTIIEKPVGEMIRVVTCVGEPDETDALAKIELFGDGRVINAYKEEEDWTCLCDNQEFTASPGKHYYFAKVTQIDGNVLWSAPVWLTVAE